MVRVLVLAIGVWVSGVAAQTPIRAPGTGPIDVLVFTSLECPISNRYAPEITRLQKQFAARGVRLSLVFANPQETPDAIGEHLKAFGYNAHVIRDGSDELVKRTGVTVTPEAAVFDARGRLVYRGRIDDRYADVGLDRQRATTHDLEDAVAAALAGRAVPNPRTRAVGCFLATQSLPAPAPTFTKDVAPIVFDRCVSCHHPGGPGPFGLLTYGDVRQRARLIADVTRRRYMPPWKAEPESGEFVGQHPLSDAEIAVIQRWVDAGAPEGSPRDLAPAPKLTEGWVLRKPDLIVNFPAGYTLQADGTDVFRIFVLRLPMSRARYVTGLEFRPGNARVVHHANIRLDRTAASRTRDAEDPAPGYDGLLARSAGYPDGHFLGWTPGQIVPLLPSELAWRLEPDTDLVIQLHMQPSGKPEAVQPSVGIFFAPENASDAGSRTPAILRLGDQGIDIPAGEASYRIADSYVLPADVDLLAVQPHAHYRAREIQGVATLPDGTKKWLIHIRDWDFRWQHVYRLVTPMRLPKGTTVAMTYTYDNSEANARNPVRPPERARWGQRSKDEMGDLWLQVITRDARDLAVLTRDAQRKMTEDDAVGYETMIRAYPDDVELHDDVAVLYLELGKADAAVRHFEASLRLRPGSAPAHYNLGTALTAAGRLDPAVAAFERALHIRPDYAVAHNNLGNVLAAQGRVDEAIRHFQEAVRLDPANARARANLDRELKKKSDQRR